MMQQRNEFLRVAIKPFVIAALVAVSFTLATGAGAVSRSMVGSIVVENPNIPGPEMSPGVYGRKVGGIGPKTYPPTAGVIPVEAVGTTAGTFVGRGVSIGANQLNRTGVSLRTFPPFINVGQLTKTHMTLQAAATFSVNNGALANCPGDGCTASGAGTAIEYCPPAVYQTGVSPLAPGTVGAKEGNWDCQKWSLAGAGAAGHRIAISNTPGAAHFGGTLELLRNHQMNVWRILVQPSTPNAGDAQASRTFMDFTNPWPGGVPNFEFASVPGNKGPLVFAQLNSGGAVTATGGCVNGIGDPGGAFDKGVVRPNAGTNCGTDTAVPFVPGQDWGFKMTTGTVSGSDVYPFGLVVTTLAGTPFNPNIGTQANADGAFFTRHGSDEITAGGNRNIVMIGGGLATDPNSGNRFFRTTTLRMNLVVPEPATGLGLFAGAGMLVGLVRRRARRA